MAIRPFPTRPSTVTVPAGAIDTHAVVSTARPVDRLLDALDAHQLAGAVLIGDDHATLLAAVKRLPTRFRGVAALSPDTKPEMLESWKIAGVAGVRLDLTGLPADARLSDLSAAPWRDILKRLAHLSLHLEVEAEGALWREIVKPLVAAGVRLVIPHFGRPGGGLGPRCPGFQALAAASRDADMWFKLSAPALLGPPAAAWSCADVLLTIPGPGQLVWGSDWPRGASDPSTYAGAIAALGDWVSDEPTRTQILGANARTLYGFNRPTTVGAAPWKRL